jgi:hypothetical protein
MLDNSPVNGAGADISVGKKIRALTATRANRNTITINSGAMFWRKKVIIINLESIGCHSGMVSVDIVTNLAQCLNPWHSKVPRRSVITSLELQRQYSRGKN